MVRFAKANTEPAVDRGGWVNRLRGAVGADVRWDETRDGALLRLGVAACSPAALLFAAADALMRNARVSIRKGRLNS